jgi:predicted NBD/HSP70 family sugar kinase
MIAARNQMLSPSLRRSNRSALLRVLLAGSGLSRTDLARDSGLSKATVTRVVDELIEEGLVRQAAELPATHRGRRAVELELAAEVGLTCGIDIGATNTRIIVSDLSGTPVGVRRLRTPSGGDAQSLTDWLVGNVFELCGDGGDADRLWSTSIGVPGVVDPQSDGITCGHNLPAVEGLAFVRAIRAALPGTVVFDNDANAALVGEMAFGAGRGCRSVVVFTLGTGIGAGVAVDGRLLRGRGGFVGEFGYLPVGGAESLTLEQAAGGAHLMQRARRCGIEIAEPAELFAANVPADVAALRREVQRALVAAFAAVTAAYEPEVIVLAGGVGESLVPWLPELQADLSATMTAAPELLPAERGDAAGCLGGLVRALELAYARLGLVDGDAQIPAWIGDGVDVAPLMNGNCTHVAAA